MLPDKRTDVSSKNKRMEHSCCPNGLPLITWDGEATGSNENVPAGSKNQCQGIRWEIKGLSPAFRFWIFFKYISQDIWQQTLFTSYVHDLCLWQQCQLHMVDYQMPHLFISETRVDDDCKLSHAQSLCSALRLWENMIPRAKLLLTPKITVLARISCLQTRTKGRAQSPESPTWPQLQNISW